MSARGGLSRYGLAALISVGALVGVGCSDDPPDAASNGGSATSTTLTPTGAVDDSTTTIAGAAAPGDGSVTTSTTPNTSSGGPGGVASPPSSRPGTIAGSPALTPTPSGTGPAPCTAAQLAAGAPTDEGAAGTASVTIPLTNHSDVACSLAGIPGIRLLGGEGGAFGAAVSSHGEPMTQVDLAVGQSASFTIFFHAATGFDPPVCQTASTIEATLPADGGRISLAATVRPCGDGSTLPTVSVSPFRR